VRCQFLGQSIIARVFQMSSTPLFQVKVGGHCGKNAFGPLRVNTKIWQTTI